MGFPKRILEKIPFNKNALIISWTCGSCYMPPLQGDFVDQQYVN